MRCIQLERTLLVLAGGQSRRLEFDKRYLKLDGEPVLRNFYYRWMDWHPVLLGGPLPLAVWPGPQWPDPTPHAGPARALDYALRRLKASAFFCSADMPWLPPTVMEVVQNRCLGHRCPWDAHVFQVDRWFIPVGLVHPSALPPKPIRAFQLWWQGIQCDVLDPQTLTQSPMPWWRDLDTPEDFRFWQRYWLDRGHHLDR